MSGAKANSNGLKFEDQVASFLDVFDISYKREVPYKGIHFNKRSNKLDFIVQLCGKKIGMECKTQNTEGTVYEKVPLVMINGHERVDCDIFIALFDGVINYNKGVIEWAKDFAKKHTSVEKQLLVFSAYSDFQEWIVEQSESTGPT